MAEQASASENYEAPEAEVVQVEGIARCIDTSVGIGKDMPRQPDGSTDLSGSE